MVKIFGHKAYINLTNKMPITIANLRPLQGESYDHLGNSYLYRPGCFDSAILTPDGITEASLLGIQKAKAVNQLAPTHQY